MPRAWLQTEQGFEDFSKTFSRRGSGKRGKVGRGCMGGELRV
jgi:hypothetical protein